MAFIGSSGLQVAGMKSASVFPVSFCNIHAFNHSSRPLHSSRASLSMTNTKDENNAKPSSFASLCKTSVAAALIALTLFTSSVDPAAAASGGGRVGGSNFRSAPAAPRSVAPSTGGGAPVIIAPTPYYSPFYSPFGGSFFMSPMFLPLGFGGGLGSLLLFGAFAAILSQTVLRRSGSEEDEFEDAFGNPKNMRVVKMKLALLDSATELKLKLESLAQSADTSSSFGLHKVLQETVLTLVRNPDYWVYGACKKGEYGRMEDVRESFESETMLERSKLSAETMSNVNSNVSLSSNVVGKSDDLAMSDYIMVTLVVAAEGSGLDGMPEVINRAEDVKNGLLALGSVSRDSLQAVEIIWTPQGKGESLTRAEMLLDHPELQVL